MLAALKAASAVKKDSQSHGSVQPVSLSKPALKVDVPSVAGRGSGRAAQDPSYVDDFDPSDEPQYNSTGSYGAGQDSMLSSGMVAHDANGAADGQIPRLFRRLPKRRRMDQTVFSKSNPVHATLLGDGQSTASSSTETHQATLYDEKSTPATSSSDEAEHMLALQDKTLVVDDAQNTDIKELDGNTVQINMTEFTKACQDGRGAEFLRERGIDLEKKDHSTADLSLAAEAAMQSVTPTAPTAQDEDLLHKRIELLSLADVDMLVRHVAQGTSFFGGAGVTAVAAGLGLYDQHDDLMPPVSGTEGEQSSEDFAKLALWATLPAAIENWISTPERDPSATTPAGGRRSTLATLYDDLLGAGGQGDGQIDTGEEGPEDQDDEFYPDSGGNHDAFDANDRERWLTRDGKSQFGKARRPQTVSSSATAIPGGSNTKKRKIPSAGPNHAEDSPMASPKISKRDENPFHSYDEPSKYSLADPSTLVSLADEILGAGPPATKAAPARPKGASRPAASSQAFKRGQSVHSCRSLHLLSWFLATCRRRDACSLARCRHSCCLRVRASTAKV